MRFYQRHKVVFTGALCVLAALPSTVLAQRQTTGPAHRSHSTARLSDVSVAHLIISSENPSHLARGLKTLADLEARGVTIGEVVLLGQSSTSEALLPQELQEKTSASPVAEILLAHKLTDGSMFDPEPLLAALHITESPTWVIRSRNSDYVFEGELRPQRLFSADGQFRESDYATPGKSDSSTLSENLPMAISTGQLHVAHHSKSRSGESLPNGPTLKSALSKAKAARDLSALAPAMQSVVRGVSYRRYLDTAPSHAGLAIDKPKCEQNVSRTERVPTLDDQLKRMDLVFYSPHDEQEVARAAEFGQNARPYTPQEGLSQLAYLLQIRCLPTRIRVLKRGVQPAIEYREGDAAWERVRE